MRRTGARLRRLADRLDRAGEPKRTSWSFTIEDGQGVVFNQDGRGCPLWYLGDADYERAHAESVIPEEGAQWVIAGFQRGEELGVVLYASNTVEYGLSRRTDGYDEISLPFGKRNAKVPRWVVTATCQLRDLTQVTAADYPSAVKELLKRWGNGTAVS